MIPIERDCRRSKSTDAVGILPNPVPLVGLGECVFAWSGEAHLLAT